MKKQIFDAHGIFAETEQYLLRQILPQDRPDYEQLALHTLPDFLHLPQDAQNQAVVHVWDTLQEDTHLTCTLIQKADHAFCGFCQLQWIFSPTPEIGIALLPSFQKQGIALEVLPIFMQQAKKILPISYFTAKVKQDNLPSQRLAEKLGGTLAGTTSPFPKDLPPELIAFAQKELSSFIDLEYHFL